MTAIDYLPSPSEPELNRSAALTLVLKNSILAAEGSISFEQFMHDALYHPQWGYYESNTFTLGKAGDFTTAPEISPLFAASFAKQAAQVFTTLKSANLLEIGAGTGRFACDILSALNEQGLLPDHYYIYEISEHLRQKQQDFLRANSPQWLSRITWLKTLPANFTGVVIANEVLDALPFQCFYLAEDGIKERRVTYQDGQFTWQLKEALAPLAEKAAYLRNHYGLPQGYASEINLQLPHFIAALTDMLTTGLLLLADYGYGEREYYRKERHLGSLTCFYKQRRHANPFIFPGLQDITAHVDFTSVIEKAAAKGCTLAGFTTQAHFLLSTGLLESAQQLEKNLSEKEAFQLHHAIKLLTFPTEMGERVKVMALTKNLELPLIGFSSQDRRRDL